MLWDSLWFMFDIKNGAGGMVTRDQQAKCLYDDLFNIAVGKLSLGGKIWKINTLTARIFDWPAKFRIRRSSWPLALK